MYGLSRACSSPVHCDRAGSSQAHIASDPLSRMTGMRSCKNESCLLASVVMMVYVNSRWSDPLCRGSQRRCAVRQIAAEVGDKLTLVQHAVPQAREQHQLPVSALDKVRNLFLAAVLLQPLIEALGHHDAAFGALHRVPQAPALGQRIIAAVDRLHQRAVVRVALRPERNQA